MSETRAGIQSCSKGLCCSDRTTSCPRRASQPHSVGTSLARGRIPSCFRQGVSQGQSTKCGYRAQHAPQKSSQLAGNRPRRMISSHSASGFPRRTMRTVLQPAHVSRRDLTRRTPREISHAPSSDIGYTDGTIQGEERADERTISSRETPLDSRELNAVIVLERSVSDQPPQTPLIRVSTERSGEAQQVHPPTIPVRSSILCASHSTPRSASAGSGRKGRRSTAGNRSSRREGV